MSRLYELVLEAAKNVDDDKTFGLCLVNSILSNRKERKDIYRRGEERNFRNKELSRVMTDLEKIASEGASADAGDLREDENLSEFRDVFRLNYAYDALKCSYQCTKDLGKTAEFLGSVMKKKALQFQAMSEYERKSMTDTQAYNDFLRNLKNAIRKKYYIILESNI